MKNAVTILGINMCAMGREDGDKSDDSLEACADWCPKNGHDFFCNGTKRECISLSDVCNGFDQCSEGFDETDEVEREQACTYAS